MGLLSRNRQKINRDLSTAEERKYFSPLMYSDFHVTAPIIQEFSFGKLIDIGCGTMPYKKLLLSKVAQYDALDIEERVDGVTFVGDAQNMHMIDNASYDSAVSFEVLEHVQEPLKAITEAHRILKKNGIYILTVPHLSRLHEEPYDFYRYTKYGLHYLLEKGGFQIIKIVPRGGLFTFLGHQWSIIFVCLFWHIPIIKNIIFFINRWFCVFPCYHIDKILDKKKIFASGYTCVCRKK